MCDIGWDNAKNMLTWRKNKAFEAEGNAGNSGELNVQFEGDDRTDIWAGTVADKFDYYFRNL